MTISTLYILYVQEDATEKEPQLQYVLCLCVDDFKSLFFGSLEAPLSLHLIWLIGAPRHRI